LKSDDAVMLDGMRVDELQRQFDVPLHPFDFDQLAAALRSNFGGLDRAFDQAA
jgi:hypothetical protein